jgi:phosphatidate cytidylyltransferase
LGELLNRVVIAVPLAVAALGAAWAGGGWMLAFGLVVVVLGLHEFYGITRSLRPIPLTGHAGGLAIVAVSNAYGLEWSLAAALGTLVATFLVTAAISARESAVVTMAVTVFGTLYVGYGVAFLVLLRGVEGPNRAGFDYLLAVFVAVWLSDIFAYFGGRVLGRHRLAPAISPNKTVEGFVIGLAMGTFGGWVTLYHHPLSSLGAFEVAIAAAIAGPLGDLFESFIKRDVGVKDSGNLLGAHGGVLDRIDALLFAGAAAYFVVIALGAV